MDGFQPYFSIILSSSFLISLIEFLFDENNPCTDTPNNVNVVTNSPIISASPKIMFATSDLDNS